MLTQLLVWIALAALAVVVAVTVSTARRRRRTSARTTRSILRDQDLGVMRERQAALAKSLPPPRRSTFSLPVGVGNSAQKVARELLDDRAR